MPALKPATIGQKLLTDFGQNRPLTTPTSGIETELMHVVKDMPIEKQETLLRIAKAL